MQASPHAHFPAGITVDDYVHSRRPLFMPLTGVAKSDFQGLAFRDGYQPGQWNGFTGDLIDPKKCWGPLNRRRILTLLDADGLWHSKPADNEGCTYDKSPQRFQTKCSPSSKVCNYTMNVVEMHWITRKIEEQGSKPITTFWKRLVKEAGREGCPLPEHLVHPQGCQFAASRAQIQRWPQRFYRKIVKVDVVYHG
eukprot:gnl/TRDRNA2_/TRDRNA2_169755_c0_seq9.p1 gnl/TRDRNA2_/TRDRNA2_169755_c0~~gnl/TRDRNA2_/TRDRNA2_169755_c0_seq9.p1  ORF type:complete len:195 (+),score=30.80 gnl/TRDRNA2_/TRDRNA2_169755_c0_seq9:554-1138(+)